MDPKLKLNTKQRSEAIIVSVKDLGENEVEAIVSTDSVDRTFEILDIEGLEIKNFQKNPTVLWAHKQDELPVAKAVEIRKEAGKLIARFKFAVDEYPFAHTVYKMIRGGYLNAVSIGFIPEAYEMTDLGDKADSVLKWIKAEMLEFSIVPVPANPEALVTGKSLELTTDEWKGYREWVEKGVTGAPKKREEEDEENAKKGDDLQKDVDGLKIGFEQLSKSVEAIGNSLPVAASSPKNRQEKKAKRHVLITLKRQVQTTDKTAESLILLINKELGKLN